MKRIHILLAIAMVGLLFSACDGNNGNGQKNNPDDYYTSCKPYTRWWWFAAQIDTADIRTQLEWMKDHEFGGVEIAWIYPMNNDTTNRHAAFLSPEWSEYVTYAKQCADKLGLGCDFTFGTLWPFSDVNLPEGDQTRTYFDSVDCAQRDGTWDHPKMAKILNHLDKNAFNRYAAKMNRGLAEAYKGSRSGVFVDSWEVETKYAWTPGFGETFIKEHGYDIEPFILHKTLMNKGNEDYFYDYMKTLSGYVLREFYEPFAANAKKNGAFSRSQCAGAPTDLIEAFSIVDIPETEAILYEPPFTKIVASAATLSNKAAVTSETFTCAYGWTRRSAGHSPHQGREQIADLKLICDALFANGANQIIWHGMPYNKVGKSDNHFYTTCQLSTDKENNLSGNAITEFNKYMTRVSQYMRKGKNYSDMAVYIPMEDSWMYESYPDTFEVYRVFGVWGQYEMRYINTPEQYKGRQPLWVNAKYLSNAHFEKGTLYCGETTFRSLYVDVEYMDYDGLSAIVKLAKEGLPVQMIRDPKEPGVNKHNDYEKLLSSMKALRNVSTTGSVIKGRPLISGENLPDFWCRQDEDTYYVFMANPMTQTIKYPLSYCYAFTDNGSQRDITVNHHGKQDNVHLNFKPMQSLVLEITKEGVNTIDLGYAPRMQRRDN